ncbi:hypothetical protein ACOMHN_040680 [Nucella lapillus]
MKGRVSLEQERVGFQCVVPSLWTAPRQQGDTACGPSGGKGRLSTPFWKIDMKGRVSLEQERVGFQCVVPSLWTAQRQQGDTACGPSGGKGLLFTPFLSVTVWESGQVHV